MDYDAMVLDQEAIGPSVKITVVSLYTISKLHTLEPIDTSISHTTAVGKVSTCQL
jgi:hypothetical protein